EAGGRRGRGRQAGAEGEEGRRPDGPAAAAEAEAARQGLTATRKLQSPGTTPGLLSTSSARSRRSFNQQPLRLSRFARDLPNAGLLAPLSLIARPPEGR